MVGKHAGQVIGVDLLLNGLGQTPEQIHAIVWEVIWWVILDALSKNRVDKVLLPELAVSFEFGKNKTIQ